MPYRVSALRTDAPGVLIISGLDPSGGAGFIADVRTAAWLGCRPVGVITASTEQNTLGMVAANAADAETVSGQLSTLLSDVEVAAVKIGMIGRVETARAIGVTPHVAQAPHSAIDARTTRHPGYAISQRLRKRGEEIFGWMKTIGLMRKTRHRGQARVGWQFLFTAAVYDLMRMGRLRAAVT